MPGTRRTPIRRHSRLTHEQQMSLEWGCGNAFADDDDRHAAWERHRDHLMAKCDDGWRPQAWWDYDSPIPRPRLEYQKAALWEAGLLVPKERTTLEQRWREDFDKANRPDWFGHCAGQKPGTTQALWLHGEEGRAAHYAWAGIPRTLVKRWTTSKRRSKAVQPAPRTAKDVGTSDAPSPSPATSTTETPPSTEIAPLVN